MAMVLLARAGGMGSGVGGEYHVYFETSSLIVTFVCLGECMTLVCSSERPQSCVRVHVLKLRSLLLVQVSLRAVGSGAFRPAGTRRYHAWLLPLPSGAHSAMHAWGYVLMHAHACCGGVKQEASIFWSGLVV